MRGEVAGSADIRTRQGALAVRRCTAQLCLTRSPQEHDRRPTGCSKSARSLQIDTSTARSENSCARSENSKMSNGTETSILQGDGCSNSTTYDLLSLSARITRYSS